MRWIESTLKTSIIDGNPTLERWRIVDSRYASQGFIELLITQPRQWRASVDVKLAPGDRTAQWEEVGMFDTIEEAKAAAITMLRLCGMEEPLEN